MSQSELVPNMMGEKLFCWQFNDSPAVVKAIYHNCLNRFWVGKTFCEFCAVLTQGKDNQENVLKVVHYHCLSSHHILEKSKFMYQSKMHSASISMKYFSLDIEIFSTEKYTEKQTTLKDSLENLLSDKLWAKRIKKQLTIVPDAGRWLADLRPGQHISQ